MKTSLYVHIPFCSAKCRYCDFFSIPLNEKTGQGESENLQKNLLDGILSELKIRLSELVPKKIETIFIGGGTPSSIKPELLDNFLTGMEELLLGLIGDDAEISIEANPESCSVDFLDVLSNHRINRLSIGVQSFDLKTLKKIGRASFPENIYDTVAGIRASWHKNLSLDIISGVTADYMDDIEKALSLSPEHLSVYSLTIEEDTPLYDDLLNSRIQPPDEELQAESMTSVSAFLEKHGFYKYEISNFALADPAFSNECRHNLMYWNMQSYIGIGPGAVSSLYFDDRKIRITNTVDLDLYISCFTDGLRAPLTCRTTEVLSKFDFLLEHYLMGIRLKKGINPDIFRARFAHGPEYFIPETLSKWQASGLTGPGCCALNEDGMLLLNRFMSEVWDELKKKDFF
ncbi:MAG: radical SAM family heme chaperone HemW [Spirochaetales bacterium]|nr:radical SAM family heme chaperone HemW [Spirochaetales bacterium]